MGDVDTKAQKLLVGVDEKLNPEDIKKHLLGHAPGNKKELSEGLQRGGGGGMGQASRLWAQSRENTVVLPARVGGGEQAGRGWGAGGRHSPSLFQGVRWGVAGSD